MTVLDSGHGLSLLANVLIHAIILFTIWAFLFNFVIKPVSSSILESEIKTLIESLVQTNKAAVPTEVKDYVNQLKSDPTSFSRIEGYLAKPTAARTLQNKWLTGISYTVPLLGLVLLVSMIMLLRYACQVQLPLSHILVENLITFLIIGAVEGALFFFIGLKICPVAPSTVQNSILTQLRSGLNCS